MSKKIGTEPRFYDEDFKRSAVDTGFAGRGPTEVARDLGVPRSCLTTWKKSQLEAMEVGEPSQGMKPSELAAQDDRLRRELAQVFEQRDILKNDTHLRRGAAVGEEAMR